MFADDIKLYCCIHSPGHCLILQNDINTLLVWSKHWLLSFNVSKCTALHIGNMPYTGNYALIEGFQLELLYNFQNLGIQISKLKFHIHTDTVFKKSYHALCLICKSFDCKDSDVIIVKLYTILVHPIIE